MAEHTEDYTGRRKKRSPRRPADEEKSPFAHQPGRRVERNITAMPIEIDYRIKPGSVICDYSGKECCFQQRNTEEWRRLADGTHTHPNSAPEKLDPFAIREAFEKVRNESDALKFLKHAGRFWPLGPDVTWSQFREWQEFVYLIRQHNLLQLAEHNDRAGQAVLALNGFPSKFFTAADCPVPDAEKQEELRFIEIDPKGASVFAQIRKERETKLYNLQKSFCNPPKEWITTEDTPNDDATAKAMNRDARAGVFSHFAPVELLREKYALKQVLVIRPPTILEAIAATIFADRRHGLKFGKCEHCKRLFEKQSERHTKYCPNKTCKNAASQKAWREKEKLRAASTLAIGTKRKTEKTTPNRKSA